LLETFLYRREKQVENMAQVRQGSSKEVSICHFNSCSNVALGSLLGADARKAGIDK